jgi:hypothetical protein
MTAPLLETHRNALVYAEGKPSLERIVALLAQRPAFPAELKRLARLPPRSWGILWAELKRSGLLTKEPSQRRWHLRSDRELIEQWQRLADRPSEIEVSPRVYARCRDIPKSNMARLWEQLRRAHIDWSAPLECPFCGHRFAAPRSGFWRQGLRIRGECPHLLFVGREGEGWVHRSSRMVRLIESQEPFVTRELLDLAALSSVGGQACRLAWPGSICLSFYRPSRGGANFFENLVSDVMHFGFAPDGPPGDLKNCPSPPRLAGCIN